MSSKLCNSLSLSVLWIVGLTNAMNLIDGLDGLASGIALLTSVTLFLISLNNDAGYVTYLYIVLAGATLGFSQRQTVLLLYFVTVLFGIIAFAFTVQLNEYAAVITVLIGVIGGMLAKELHLFGERPREVEREYVHEDAQATLFKE